MNETDMLRSLLRQAAARELLDTLSAVYGPALHEVMIHTDWDGDAAQPRAEHVSAHSAQGDHLYPLWTWARTELLTQEGFRLEMDLPLRPESEEDLQTWYFLVLPPVDPAPTEASILEASPTLREAAARFLDLAPVPARDFPATLGITRKGVTCTGGRMALRAALE